MEDDPMMSTLVKMQLRRMFPEAEIVFAPDGDQGWELFEADADIDIVITDLLMKNEDTRLPANGNVFAEKARGLRPGVPIVLITGTIPGEDEFTGLFDQILVKPHQGSGLREIKAIHGEQDEEEASPSVSMSYDEMVDGLKAAIEKTDDYAEAGIKFQISIEGLRVHFFGIYDRGSEGIAKAFGEILNILIAPNIKSRRFKLHFGENKPSGYPVHELLIRVINPVSSPVTYEYALSIAREESVYPTLPLEGHDDILDAFARALELNPDDPDNPDVEVPNNVILRMSTVARNTPLMFSRGVSKQLLARAIIIRDRLQESVDRQGPDSVSDGLLRFKQAVDDLLSAIEQADAILSTAANHFAAKDEPTAASQVTPFASSPITYGIALATANTVLGSGHPITAYGNDEISRIIIDRLAVHASTTVPPNVALRFSEWLRERSEVYPLQVLDGVLKSITDALDELSKEPKSADSDTSFESLSAAEIRVQNAIEPAIPLMIKSLVRMRESYIEKISQLEGKFPSVARRLEIQDYLLAWYQLWRTIEIQIKKLEIRSTGKSKALKLASEIKELKIESVYADLQLSLRVRRVLPGENAADVLKNLLRALMNAHGLALKNQTPLIRRKGLLFEESPSMVVWTVDTQPFHIGDTESEGSNLILTLNKKNFVDALTLASYSEDHPISAIAASPLEATKNIPVQGFAKTRAVTQEHADGVPSGLEPAEEMSDMELKYMYKNDLTGLVQLYNATLKRMREIHSGIDWVRRRETTTQQEDVWYAALDRNYEIGWRRHRPQAY